MDSSGDLEDRISVFFFVGELEPCLVGEGDDWVKFQASYMA